MGVELVRDRAHTQPGEHGDGAEERDDEGGEIRGGDTRGDLGVAGLLVSTIAAMSQMSAALASATTEIAPIARR